MLDPAREAGHGRIRYVFVLRRQRTGIALAALELVAVGPDVQAGQSGVPLRGGLEGRFELSLARPSAALVESRHRRAPAIRCDFGVCGRHLNLDELLRLGESSRGNHGTYFRRCSESRWRTRRKIRRILRLAAKRGGSGQNTERGLRKELTARFRHESSGERIVDEERKVAGTARLRQARRLSLREPSLSAGSLQRKEPGVLARCTPHGDGSGGYRRAAQLRGRPSLQCARRQRWA